ncbi:MAG: 3-isopropylmalate dehydratase small subunit [Herbaspirillum sp.]
MKPFTVIEGYAAPLMQDNIDTDVIVRIERIAKLHRGEFAPWAFEALRYLDGAENPDFILNRTPFQTACILISGANFGCGSSREMAVWAIEEFGICCIIAQSYGDIFFGNCLQNGLLPITLKPDLINKLAKVAASGAAVKIDLNSCVISTIGVDPIPFEFPETQRQALLSGLDEVDQTLNLLPQITEFQAQGRRQQPWVYLQNDN